MFYGREAEFVQLGRLWRKPVASLVTCRGRRRIGKSTLIEKFAARSGARLIEIEGLPPQPNQTNADQLSHFAEQLRTQSSWTGDGFSGWYDAFSALDREIGEEKTVVLLDEISWTGAHDKNFPGILKTAWDRHFKKHPRLIIVLCGSVSAWIQKNILDNTGFVGRSSMDIVVGELPLKDCLGFWGDAVNRIAARDIFDVLSVTGGVPRYLEEVDPTLSAVENLNNMCFSPKSFLREDFERIFNSVFGANAPTKRRILQELSCTPSTMTELCSAMGLEKSGVMSEHLAQLETAGFIVGDVGLNPRTRRHAKMVRYRNKDNYSRFYLKYIEPNSVMIDQNAFRLGSLDALPGWDAMMGLQFETLVINNLTSLLPALGLDRTLLLSAAPFRQLPTKRKRGCQIDLLIQTESSVCIVEVKRRKEIGTGIDEELREKVLRLDVKPGLSVRTALVYDGTLSPRVEATGYIDRVVNFADLLK